MATNRQPSKPRTLPATPPGPRAVSFAPACAQYLNRYTMDHQPEWTREMFDGNGKFYAPHFRSDQEWYDRTTFPGERGHKGDRTNCHTTGQTWPLGKWLDTPYALRTRAPAPRLTKAQEAQRLALAAPDLLEALEGLDLCVEVDQWKPGMDRAGWLQQARAAIDLAKNGKRSSGAGEGATEMEKDTEKTVVVFRASVGDIEGVTAVFPFEPWDRDGKFATCYAAVGQHGACSDEWARAGSMPATAAQYGRLKAELEGLGYNLKVRKSYPRNAAVGRRKATFETKREDR